MLHVRPSNIVKLSRDHSDIRNALVPFSSAPAEFEHHRNTNKHKTHKKYDLSQTSFRSSFHSPFFSKSSPTLHLQLSWEMEAGGAVLPSGQGMQSTEVSFLKWSGGHISHWAPEPFLSCSRLLCQKIAEQHWANRHPRGCKKIWQPAGVRSKDPNHSKSRSLQLRHQPGLQLHSLFGAKRLGVITSWLLVISKPFAKVGARTCQNHPSMLTFGTTKQYQTA